MECVDDSEGPLDPRIQVELENLNSATEDINKLEIELDEAHTGFKNLLSESTRHLKEIAEKVGSSCVEKARYYYEALDEARRAQVQCQYQAHLFQRASEIHAAAKETAALAEARFISHKHEWNFDQTWQDVLNHATTQVMDAENQKAECAREHRRKALVFQNAEIRVQRLKDKYNRAIIKARPYFEARAMCDHKLGTQKERVECLQKAVKDVKQSYARSFHILEEISDQIHEKRRSFDMIANGPREPGVGAELLSSEENSNCETELNKTSSRIHASTRTEVNASEENSKAQDFENTPQLELRMENISNRLVDGSEAVLSQSEIELQASLEKLGNLSSEMSRLDADQKNLNSSLSNADKFRRSIGDEWCNNGSELKTSEDATSTNVTSNTGILEEESNSSTSSPMNSISSEFEKTIENDLSNVSINYAADAETPREKSEYASENHPINEASCTKHNFRELPLLSIVQQRNSLKKFNGKSYSMINLTEINNLRSSLNASVLHNMQTISSERLANARSVLLETQTANDKSLVEK